MPLTLESPFFDFVFEPASGRWSLTSRSSPGGVGLARLGLRYRTAGQQAHWTGAFPGAAAARAGRASPHGPLECLRLDSVQRRDGLAPDSSNRGLALRAEFALTLEQPFFLWRLTARNTGAHPLLLDRFELLAGAGLHLHPEPGEMAFFTNGAQSWSYGGALAAGDRFPRTRLGPILSPLKVNRGTPQPFRPGHFASDMFGVLADRTHRVGLLAGFLSQAAQFGSLEAILYRRPPSLSMWANGDGVRLDPGAETSTDWALLQFLPLDAPDPAAPAPLDAYLRAVAIECGARTPAETPVGWCSWYHYFNRVTEADMLANLEAVAAGQQELPLTLFQLDDGYQADVGDWFERNDTFGPHQLGWLAGRIRAEGLTPGLWLAPFGVKPTARLGREHPDWLLRGAGGRPVNAGYVFDQWTHALDTTHPEVQHFLRRLIQSAVREWGFPYLKLDFLYMAALPGRRYDPHLTRAAALRGALALIREAAGPETFLLGCGCPLGSGIGAFDGMRISADVAPNWRPQYFGTSFYFAGERDTMAAARNAIHNTLTRAPMHRRWWLNDPDCLLVRDLRQNALTLDEVTSLASVIALSGGMLLLSDDLTGLSRERRRLIRPLLPVVGRAARAVDWADATTPGKLLLPMSGPAGAWWVIGLFNWEDRLQPLTLRLADFGLPAGRPYHAVDFWNQRYYRFETEELFLGEVPAHGGVLLALREVCEGVQWVGSDLHFTQGFEVAHMDPEGNPVRARIRLGRQASGRVWLQLPQTPVKVWAGERLVEAERVGDDLYQIPVRVAHEAQILVHTEP